MIKHKNNSVYWQASKKQETMITGLSGILCLAEFAEQMGLFKTLDSEKKLPHAWSRRQVALALVLLQLAGGESVQSIETLTQDPGFQRLWKKNRGKAPSKNTLHRVLYELDTDVLLQCNDKLLAHLQDAHPQSTATLDQDATIVPSQQSCATYTYKDIKGFQPSTVLWHEQRTVLDSEYRDGNHPAAKGILEQLQCAVNRLPEGVQTIRYRADSASYQKSVIQYCQQQSIEFSISTLVCRRMREEAAALPNEAWKPLLNENGIHTGESYTTLAYFPDWPSEGLQFIAVRKRLSPQLEIEFGEDEGLPAKQVIINNRRYRLTVMVTNRQMSRNDLILWHRKRCGLGEAVHAALKHDVAGHWTPSKHFRSNAAWWTLAMIAHNLHEWFKSYFPYLRHKRLKYLRLHFLHAPGRIIQHARRWIIQVTPQVFQWIQPVTLALAQPPP